MPVTPNKEEMLWDFDRPGIKGLNIPGGYFDEIRPADEPPFPSGQFEEAIDYLLKEYQQKREKYVEKIAFQAKGGKYGSYRKAQAYFNRIREHHSAAGNHELLSILDEANDIVRDEFFTRQRELEGVPIRHLESFLSQYK